MYLWYNEFIRLEGSMDKNITIRDLLETEGFEEFKVLAGASGLDTGVTSITIMDSPNPFPWSKGGEVVLSSGYVFKQHIDDFEELIIKMKGAGLVALFIKVKRYFDYLPDTILELADKIGFVIVEVPIEMAFIDVINPRSEEHTSELQSRQYLVC